MSCSNINIEMSNPVDLTTRSELVGITELLEAVQKFQNVSEDSQLKYVLEVLDQDKDGAIDINDALKVTTAE